MKSNFQILRVVDKVICYECGEDFFTGYTAVCSECGSSICLGCYTPDEICEMCDDGETFDGGIR